MKSTGEGQMMQVFVHHLDETLFTITTEKQDKVVETFLDWLTGKARLKQVPDLADRISKMEPKLRKLAKNLDVGYQGGKLVVKADADSTALLSLLRRGSDWFEPHPGVDAAILSALVKGAT